MERVVKPEMLDALPHEHPEALRSRRELRLINALMGNHRWLLRQARAHLPSGCSALELGAGTGELAKLLQRRLGLALDGIDLCPAPSDWPAERRWWRSDLLRFAEWHGYDAVLANLILHQFEDHELAEMGRRISPRTRFIFACEPARFPLHLTQFKALTLLCGLGRVSRNDGEASIRAGFHGEELPRLLGLEEGEWMWRCRTNFVGRYSMFAWRRGSA